MFEAENVVDAVADDGKIAFVVVEAAADDSTFDLSYEEVVKRELVDSLYRYLVMDIVKKRKCYLYADSWMKMDKEKSDKELNNED